MLWSAFDPSITFYSNMKLKYVHRMRQYAASSSHKREHKYIINFNHAYIIMNGNNETAQFINEAYFFLKGFQIYKRVCMIYS